MTSHINPGTIIRIKVALREMRSPPAPISVGRKWYYAIHIHGSLFYITDDNRTVNLSDYTLLRAHLDNRLEIIND